MLHVSLLVSHPFRLHDASSRSQVTSPVLWENTMDLVLSKEFGKAYELGPGKVTAGILKRFSKTAECINVEV